MQKYVLNVFENFAKMCYQIHHDADGDDNDNGDDDDDYFNNYDYSLTLSSILVTQNDPQ